MSTTTAEPREDGPGCTVYRLELPPELAEPLIQAADANERTLPGQIRYALKAWLNSSREVQ